MANLEVKAVITAEDKASKKINKLGKSFSKLAKVGIGAAVVGVGALTIGLKKSIDAFAVQEKAASRLRSSFKFVGGITEDAAKEMEAYAASLQKVTTFGDEQIISAQAQLGTFGLTTDQVKDLSMNLLDMATFQEKTSGTAADLDDVAKALGKSFTTGAGALSRYGVTMTEAEQKMFTAGTVTEKVTMLQKILNDNYGGAATNAANTYSGKLDQLKNNFGDMQESIGKVLLEALNPLVEKLNTWSQDPANQEKVKNLAEAFRDKLGEGIKWAKDKFQELKDWYDSGGKQNLQEWKEDLLLIAGAVLAIVGAIGQALHWFFKYREEIGKVIRVQQGIMTGGISEIIRGISGAAGRRIKARQHGGPVAGGQPYMVGEAGPELFVPSQSGQIVPNNQVSNFNFSFGDVNNTSNSNLDDIGRRLSRQIQLSRQGI